MFNIKRRLFLVKNKKTTQNGRIPNAMVIVEKTKKRIFRYINPKFIPSNSFDREYNGMSLHILGLDLKGQFWPIERGAIETGRMPTDLFMAKHCADEVNDVYGMSIPTIEKIKIGLLIGLCVTIVVVLFLTVTATGG